MSDHSSQSGFPQSQSNALLEHFPFSFAVRFFLIIFPSGLLAYAGIAKLAGLITSDPGLLEIVLGRNMTLLLGVFQVAISSLLLLSPRSVGPWLICVLMYCLFVIIEFVFLANGHASCQCFGAVSTPIVVTLPLSFIAILCLLLSWPSFSRAKSSIETILSAIFTVLLLGYFALDWGRVFRDSDSDFGVNSQNRLPFFRNGRVGESASGVITLKNKLNSCVRIVGFSESTGVTDVSQLPLEIGPGQTGAVHVTLKRGKKVGLGATMATLFWSDQGEKNPALKRVSFPIAFSSGKSP